MSDERDGSGRIIRRGTDKFVSRVTYLTCADQRWDDLYAANIVNC